MAVNYLVTKSKETYEMLGGTELMEEGPMYWSEQEADNDDEEFGEEYFGPLVGQGRRGQWSLTKKGKMGEDIKQGYWGSVPGGSRRDAETLGSCEEGSGGT